MKRKICFILLFCAVFLLSCTDSRKRSCLHALVTEEQTLLCGDYTQNGKPLTEEDICYDLRGVDIDFSMDDYIFEKAEENEEGLLYYVDALSPDDPDFKVYQIGNFCGITSGAFPHVRFQRIYEEDDYRRCGAEYLFVLCKRWRS